MASVAAKLKSRAITQVARDACEEVLFGLHYTPEELGAEVDADGEPLEQRTVRSRGPVVGDQWQTPAPQVAPEAAAEYADVVEDDVKPPEASMEQLRSIAGGLNAVRGVSGVEEAAKAVSEILGREVNGPGDVSAEEAEQVLAVLREEHKAQAAAERQASEAQMTEAVKPKYISGSQLTALKGALAKKHGIDERTALLAWCAALALWRRSPA